MSALIVPWAVAHWRQGPLEFLPRPHYNFLQYCIYDSLIACAISLVFGNVNVDNESMKCDWNLVVLRIFSPVQFHLYNERGTRSKYKFNIKPNQGTVESWQYYIRNIEYWLKQHVQGKDIYIIYTRSTMGRYIPHSAATVYLHTNIVQVLQHEVC